MRGENVKERREGTEKLERQKLKLKPQPKIGSGSNNILKLVPALAPVNTFFQYPPLALTPTSNYSRTSISAPAGNIVRLQLRLFLKTVGFRTLISGSGSLLE